MLHEQLAEKLDAKALAQADAIMRALSEGKPVEHYPPELAVLFRPSVEKLWRSELPPDPAKLIAHLKMPIAIVQGDTDVQMGVDDARRLAAANHAARLSVLAHVNHVLKEEAERRLPQASYADESLPLGPGVAKAVLAGVAK